MHQYNFKQPKCAITSSEEFFSVSNYSGGFYIELETEYTFKDVDLVTALNDHSSRLINGDGFARWEMVGLSEALKVVLQLQAKKYPFRLMGDRNILFIEGRE